MFITNVSRSAVEAGNHAFEPDNTILISIRDICTELVKAPAEFMNIYDFEFQDSEDSELGIQEAQARELAAILEYAVDLEINVVVNCVAGICRSGAVVEVGTMIGFRDLGAHRIPNTRVKTMLIQALGLGY